MEESIENVTKKKAGRKPTNGNETYLDSFESCRRWIRSLKKSTRRAYKFHLTKFCLHYKITPDELVKLPHPQIQIMFEDYVQHLSDIAVNEVSKAVSGRLSVNSVRPYTRGIKSFLDYQGIPLIWKRISALFPEEVPTELRPYTKEEISILYGNTKDDRERSMILCQSSGGVRVGGGVGARLKDCSPLIKDKEGKIVQIGDINKTGVALIMTYAVSKKSMYPTFITPECRESLNKYLKFRTNQGEILKPESPLIRDYFEFGSPKTNNPKFVFETNVNHIINRIAKRGSKTVDLHDIAPNHGLREFYYGTIRNSHVDKDFRDLLMGHKINMGDKCYYDLRKSESHRDRVLSEFLKAVDDLTIDEKFRLKKQVARLTEQQTEQPQIADLMRLLTNERIKRESIELQLQQDQQVLQDVKEIVTRLSNSRPTDAEFKRNQIAILSSVNDYLQS